MLSSHISSNVLDFDQVVKLVRWWVVCSGPREDATRIGSAGVVRRQAVDISPLRRVNQVSQTVFRFL